MAIDADNGRTEDALSDVLRLIRLSGCVYFQSEFAAPWGMTMEAAPPLAPPTVARRPASFVVISNSTAPWRIP